MEGFQGIPADFGDDSRLQRQEKGEKLSNRQLKEEKVAKTTEKSANGMEFEVPAGKGVKGIR